MVVSYQWCDGHWYEYRCYKTENFYYRMWVETWECQSIWALADILLTWIPCVIVFYLFHPYSWDNWGGYVFIHIDWLRCIIIPSIKTILCTCIEMRLSISWARGDRPCWGWWDVKIVIWARGDRPCENYLILW